MIIGLLTATFLIALAVSSLAAWLFHRPIQRIMGRIIPDEISAAWVRYMMFALYVVGIAGGVGIRRLERYISPDEDGVLLALTGQRWVLEIYSTAIGTLAAITWMLLVFFVFALIAYVVVRGMELRREHAGDG